MSAYGTYDRMSRYSDYAEMEYTPEIASALDIYSEETVANDDKGRVLTVYSENRQIQRLLEELFYDTLNVEFNLTPWSRDMVKHGDFFLFNDVSPEYGVLNVFPIPVNEIEREEGYDPQDPMAVRFRWITNGNTILENWQITHFRLLGNDAFLPYGTSVLESARRIWRQLILIEDAMLVYRVVRSPERRVFYVDVGNVPPEDVPNYMEQAKTILRSNQVVDSQTGRVDLRYNPLPVWSKTPIPLLDGRTITIKDLAKEFDEGKENWVYSIQDDTQRIVPGKVVWCGKNYTAEKLIKVWLDDDTWAMTAPEHPFVLRDGSNKRADKLTAGDRLMPLYRRLSNKSDGDYVDDYEQVYDPHTSRFIYTHKAISRTACIDHDRKLKNKTIHHVNHKKWDNRPENLQAMTWFEHKAHHASANRTQAHRDLVSMNNKKYNKGQNMAKMYNGSLLHKQHNEIRSKVQSSYWNDKIHSRNRCNNMSWNIPASIVEFSIHKAQTNPRLTRENLTEAIRNNKTLIEDLAVANSENRRDPDLFSSAAIINAFKRNGVCNNWTELRALMSEGEIEYKNHSVSRVEEVYKNEDVYCMTVVGPDGQDDRHNFAMQTIQEGSKESTLNSLEGLVRQDKNLTPSSGRTTLPSGIFVKNSVDEDYFIPTRGGEGGSKIETLAGGTNVTAIEDVEYIQKKLFSALKIPKAYLGYDEAIGSKATLSQEDIRFSRTINRIQRTVISELNKLAIIHLYSNGYEGEDLLDFELNLCNPSTVAQQQKLEIYRTRLEIAGSAPEGVVDRYWIRKNIMNLTDDEIDRIEKGRVDDKTSDLKIEGISQETSGESDDFSGGGGGGFGGLGGGGEDFGEEGEGEPGEEGEEPADGEDAGGDEDDGDLDDDLFASQTIKGLTLIDEDDDDTDEEFTYSINDGDAPIKAQAQLDKVLKNRKRRKTHGPEKTGIPDFKRMVNHERPGDSLTDPYDTHRLNQIDPMKEIVGREDPFDAFLNRSVKQQARISLSLKSTLKSLKKEISKKAPRSIITESDAEGNNTESEDTND